MAVTVDSNVSLLMDLPLEILDMVSFAARQESYD